MRKIIDAYALFNQNFPKADINADHWSNKEKYPHWKTDITGIQTILENAPAVSEMTTLVTLSDGYGHVREAYYDEVRQLVFTECISVKDLDSRYININERKELSDNEDSQL